MADNTVTRRGIGFTVDDLKYIRQIQVKHGVISVSQAVKKAIKHYAEHLKRAK